MKISVAKAEPFGGVDSVVEGEEEGVVEFLVHDLGGKHEQTWEAELA